MFVNKRTILSEICIRVHVRWTKKSGNKAMANFILVGTFSLHEHGE